MKHIVGTILITCLLLTAIPGCRSVSVEDFAETKPVLDLKQYFNGPVEAWGLVQKPDGRIIKRFHVQIDSNWKDNVGTLHEYFQYGDGSRDERIWTIVDKGKGLYEGKASDVIGHATGIARGSALNWSYVLRLPVDGKVYEVSFDDWMFLQDDQTLINRAKMSKFGLHLADITLFFQKKKVGELEDRHETQ